VNDGWICLDASVALLWLAVDAETAAARRLRRHCNQEGVRMIAPSFFRAEVTSVIRRWLHNREIDEEYARDAVRRSLRFPVELASDFDALHLRAFDIATKLQQSRAYDTLYLALAEFRRCDLWTADKRFVNSAGRDFANVRWIGDFPG
jgi:predicted nucleic acid-binding protein